jgi:hypothetical protein
MNKDQWTVTGLIIVLAALEVIRSPSVRSFFTGFFSQFGVGSSGASSIPSTNAPISQQPVKGMPTPGPGTRRNY